MQKALIFIGCILWGLLAQSQHNTTPKKRIKLFVDCSNTWCDLTYIRTEINVVDFVIDRIAADVHLLITSQPIGSGGEQIQLIFYGLNQYAKQNSDTLRCETLPLATDAERRDLMVRYIQAGLAPYIAKSGYLNEVTIQTKLQSDSLQKEKSGNQTTIDKWNYWVFSARANGNFSADQNYRSRNIGGRLSATRVTDDLRVSFSMNGNDDRNLFIISNNEIIVRNHSLNFENQIAKSINEHWTVGYDLSATQATFTNIKSQVYFSPGIEYNIFPYSKVNSKLLTIRYGPDIRRNAYYDTTIYQKTKEWLTGHNLSVNLSLNQKWGTVSTGITYRNFFNNWKYLNLSFNTFVDVRLTGNLSFNIFALPSIVRDQVFLPKGSASSDDVLARRRQLQTNFNFFMGFGITYRFGSILNNFVNPRFGNSGGGMFFF